MIPPILYPSSEDRGLYQSDLWDLSCHGESAIHVKFHLIFLFSASTIPISPSNIPTQFLYHAWPINTSKSQHNAVVVPISDRRRKLGEVDWGQEWGWVGKLTRIYTNPGKSIWRFSLPWSLKPYIAIHILISKYSHSSLQVLLPRTSWWAISRQEKGQHNDESTHQAISLSKIKLKSCKNSLNTCQESSPWISRLQTFTAPEVRTL